MSDCLLALYAHPSSSNKRLSDSPTSTAAVPRSDNETTSTTDDDSHASASIPLLDAPPAFPLVPPSLPISMGENGSVPYVDPRILYMQHIQHQLYANLYAQQLAQQMMSQWNSGFYGTNNFDPHLLAERLIQQEREEEEQEEEESSHELTTKIKMEEESPLVRDHELVDDSSKADAANEAGKKMEDCIDADNDYFYNDDAMVDDSSTSPLPIEIEKQLDDVLKSFDAEIPQRSGAHESTKQKPVFHSSKTSSTANKDPSMSDAADSSTEQHQMKRCSNPQSLIDSFATYRHLNEEERQALLRDAADITNKLMRIYSLCDIDVLVLNCSLEKKVVLDRKASCVELLVAADELENGQCFQTESEKPVSTTSTSSSSNSTVSVNQNPLKLACDIYHGQRTLFPKYEVLLDKRERYANQFMRALDMGVAHPGGDLSSSFPDVVSMPPSTASNPGNIVVDPYQRIPYKYDMRRGETLREIASNYTALYRKSPSNQVLTVKEASIDEIEELFRNYHKDGYRLSPSVKAYLESHVSNSKYRLGPIEPSHTVSSVSGKEDSSFDQNRSLLPICWDISKVPISIKYAIYKVIDGRRSQKARDRAKTLVHFSKRYISNRKVLDNSFGGPEDSQGSGILDVSMHEDEVEADMDTGFNKRIRMDSGISMRTSSNTVAALPALEMGDEELDDDEEDDQARFLSVRKPMHHAHRLLAANNIKISKKESIQKKRKR